jgi:hypothetical protein
MSRTISMIFCIALAALCSGRSEAANLVANPGFETGDFTGWTVTGDGILIDSTFPNTGTYDAAFSALTTDHNPGVLSQTLATTAGQSYTLSFALLDEAGFSGDSFIVKLGAFTQTITGDEAAPPGDLPSLYAAESFTVPGADISGASTVLSFEGLNFPNIGIDWNLDDVSVTGAAVPGVPEPSAGALLLAALGVCLGLVPMTRRRKQEP